jgi:hypothetical protein
MTKENPFGVLTEAAVTLHEFFKSFIDAGFTEQQALYLLGQMLTTQMKASTDGEETPPR